MEHSDQKKQNEFFLIHTWIRKNRSAKSGINWDAARFRKVKNRLRLRVEGKVPVANKNSHMMSEHLLGGQCWRPGQYLVAGGYLNSHHGYSWGAVIDAATLKVVRPALFTDWPSVCLTLAVYRDLAVVVSNFYVHLLPIDDPNAKVIPVQIPDLMVSDRFTFTNVSCGRNLRIKGSLLVVQTADKGLVMVDLAAVDLKSLETSVKH